MGTSMTPAEITRLRDDLGSNTLLAVVSGSRNRHDAEKWVSGQLVPTDDQLARFAVTREIFDRVAEQDGAATARTLFLSANSIINSERVMLMMAIREGHFDAARVAAQRMLDCEWL